MFGGLFLRMFFFCVVDVGVDLSSVGFLVGGFAGVNFCCWCMFLCYCLVGGFVCWRNLFY